MKLHIRYRTWDFLTSHTAVSFGSRSVLCGA